MRDAEGALLVGRAAEMREMDRRTIEEVGLPGVCLMESAGAGTARLIIERQGPGPRKTVVLCGGGNNGGDGYVVARYLRDAGWPDVVCVTAGDTGKLKGDAAFNHRLWTQVSGGKTLSHDHKRVRSLLTHAEVIVDALFGIGLARAIEGPAATLIRLANAAGRAFRVAVDLPSGVLADTGRAFDPVYAAHLSVTYGISKIGLHQWPGAGLAGEVQVVPIGLPRPLVEEIGACARLVEERTAARLLPERPKSGHKGTFGHVGVVGGAAGMEGAAVLAALGAFRAGAGLVTWNRPPHPDGEGAARASIPARPTELMVHDMTASQALDGRSTVLVVGPGLGRGDAAEAALDLAIGANKPLVVDADGLNVLGHKGTLPADAVATPHPAEAARLLACSTGEVQGDRPAAAQALADRLGCVVVLKGAASIVSAPALAAQRAPLAIVAGAQPALSVAGSGDVLSGVIGALLGQGVPSYDAARLGVYLHARAGDRVGLRGAGRGALASEIAEAVTDVCGHLTAARPWHA